MSTCYIHINVYVPDTEAEIRQVIETVNLENGDGDSGATYESMIDPDWEYNPDDPQTKDGFDPSDFAFYILNNRFVSPTADRHITLTDYDMGDY